MAPTTRKTTTEQRSKQGSAGVVKPGKAQSQEATTAKWTKQHKNFTRDKAKAGERRDPLTLLNEEIEELEKKPDSHEKAILLSAALARKRNMKGKSRVTTTVDQTTGPEIAEAGDVEMSGTNDGDTGKHKQDEEKNDEQTEIVRKDVQTSIEGKVSESNDADGLAEKIIHGIPWYVRDGSPIVESALINERGATIGYRKRGSGRMYLVRYGTAESCSTRFESKPDSLSENPEESLVDVACEESRIIEQIISWHKKKGLSVPDGILSKAQILSVYWDKKEKLGAEVKEDLQEYLGPRPPSRTSVRCLVYLDPELYAEKGWGIENLSGLSHETRTTMLTCVNGITRKAREIELFNIAVRLENRFQRRFQSEKASLQFYSRQQSARSETLRQRSLSETPRRTSRHRTPSRQPSYVRENRELSEESDFDDEGYEEPGYTDRRSKRSQKATVPITEKSMERIMVAFAADFESRIMKRIDDALVDRITKRVLERIRQQDYQGVIHE